MVAYRYGISLLVFDSILVRCAHSQAIELNIRREISYLRAPMYYSLFMSMSPRCCMSVLTWVARNPTVWLYCKTCVSLNDCKYMKIMYVNCGTVKKRMWKRSSQL